MTQNDNNAIPKARLWKVIFASSAGTIIEWYDFYIFGMLAFVVSTKFFPPDNPTAAFLSTLATHGIGFVARPFGAIIFGRLGDRVGRKYTFLLTLLLMGGSTFLLAFVPEFSSIGFLAPIILLILRIVQGLALGGEYGGAATYVAEHAPDNQRGKFTSYIQTTASLGFFASIVAIVSCQAALGKEAFAEWGWRIPFGLSGVLVILSYFLRRNMEESPLFTKLKTEGKLSKTPLRDTFSNPATRRIIVIAALGAIIGQGVVWHTSQFYSQIFIGKVLNVANTDTQFIMGIAVILATPLFVVFGSLSDKIGRKKVMMTGMFLAAICFYPIYWGMDKVVGEGQVVQTTQEGSITKTIYSNGKIITSTTSDKAGLPPKIEVKLPVLSCVWLVALVFCQIVFATMVYGPIAAFLVELFPTNIRYTALSVPYHFSNGIFGGCAPFIATWLGATTGSKFAGIYYPIALATLSFIVGILYLKETKGKKLAEI